MTTRQRDQMISRAARDPKISAGSLQLLLRLLLSPPLIQPEPFPLSNKDVAAICGITDKATIYRRINQLVPRYLTRAELSGCPPIWKFNLNHK